MADQKRLNERQLDVLAWIAQGCPPRDWPDSTYKVVAVALQSRRLVVVSKRGGVWSARITDSGLRVHFGEPYGPAAPRKPAPRSLPGPHPHTRPDSDDARYRRTIAEALLARLDEQGGTLELAEPTPEERADIRRALKTVEESALTPNGRILRTSGLTRGRLRLWLAAPSAVDIPITSRQYDVLRWAANGRSTANVDVAAYRSAARQLHNRGLLRITGQRSQLTAAITDRGQEVMARQEGEIEQRRRAELRAAEQAATQRQELAGRRKRALALLDEVIAGGGRLELGDRYSSRELLELRLLVRAERLAPSGQQLETEPTIMDERLGYTAFLFPDFDARFESRPVLASKFHAEGWRLASGSSAAVGV